MAYGAVWETGEVLCLYRSSSHGEGDEESGCKLHIVCCTALLYDVIVAGCSSNCVIRSSEGAIREAFISLWSTPWVLNGRRERREMLI